MPKTEGRYPSSSISTGSSGPTETRSISSKSPRGIRRRQHGADQGAHTPALREQPEREGKRTGEERNLRIACGGPSVRFARHPQGRDGRREERPPGGNRGFRMHPRKGGDGRHGPEGDARVRKLRDPDGRKGSPGVLQALLRPQLLPKTRYIVHCYVCPHCGKTYDTSEKAEDAYGLSGCTPSLGASFPISATEPIFRGTVCATSSPSRDSLSPRRSS